MAVGPGTVAGLVPYLLTGWRSRHPPPGIPVRAAGGVLIGVGGTMITSAFVRFVREGLGTPVPIAPPTELVVGGVYCGAQALCATTFPESAASLSVA
jgi:hypothetical protein